MLDLDALGEPARKPAATPRRPKPEPEAAREPVRVVRAPAARRGHMTPWPSAAAAAYAAAPPIVLAREKAGGGRAFIVLLVVFGFGMGVTIAMLVARFLPHLGAVR